ncbi:hypothetical protein [Denitratimonas sp. CY0512]|uniref:hypothetical protein n=1 Tax=Denitratimonas sp. CY0512 TaxID=3131940 RepID=UPI0030AE5217
MNKKDLQYIMDSEEVPNELKEVIRRYGEVAWRSSPDGRLLSTPSAFIYGPFVGMGLFLAVHALLSLFGVSYIDDPLLYFASVALFMFPVALLGIRYMSRVILSWRNEMGDTSDEKDRIRKDLHQHLKAFLSSEKLSDDMREFFTRVAEKQQRRKRLWG